MKELVEHFSAAKLSPATIRDYTNIAKGVVASAIDENGEEMFPRKWNEEYIDAPIIENQRQPSTNSAGVAAIVLGAGEALGLDIDKHISEDFRTLGIEQKAKRGKIENYLKRKNGTREVDLCPTLAAMLREYVGLRTSGLLFRTSTGAQQLQSNTLQDSLHPILDAMNLVKGGFNIFRRFRITHLEKSDCPQALKHFWSGHAQAHVSERYVKLLTAREYRLEWAERVGTGFLLPVSQEEFSASAGPLGLGVENTQLVIN